MTQDQSTAPAVAHRLHIGSDGRLRGKAWLTYNEPSWPALNGQPGLTPPMRGLVLHSMVGDLPGTVAVFNQPGFNASAHVGIGGPWSGTEKAGAAQIHQFGPLNGWEAWHAMDANNYWFGAEVEDGGDPAHPMTDAQLTAVAQVLEALSAQGGGWGFPLRVTNSVRGHGLSAHYIGGANWGGHTCPDPAPGGQGPRSHQRHEIVRRAKILRDHGQYPAPVPPPAYVTVTADGIQTLGAIAAAAGIPVSTTLRLTAEHGPSAPEFGPAMAGYLNQSLGGTIPPAGTALIVPANTAKGSTA